jgi:ketosteroid isomerase-like protein
MSANLDLVRSIYADWERGDFSRTDWADPEIEMTTPDAWEIGEVKGLRSTAETWRTWLSAWRDYRVEASEFRDLDDDRVMVLVDDDRVMVLGRMRRRGRLSDAVGVAEIVNVLHIRDGKVIRLVMYPNRDRALADLGLTPVDETQ